MEYVIFASMGNDSVALIQWAYEKKLKGVTVAYSNTGWASLSWVERVNIASKWVESLGFRFVEIKSEGMKNLVRRKKAFPRGGGGKYQFCTQELKEIPAKEWLDHTDPNKYATCLIGVRREESANRRTHPEWVFGSEKHGGRDLHAPLVRYDERMRNELIARTPFDVLPHRSRECSPCVNRNQKELKILPETDIIKVEALEKEMGINSKGNPRVLFSPKRHGGAIGIRAVINDAKKCIDDLFDGAGCDGGWCGD